MPRPAGPPVNVREAMESISVAIELSNRDTQADLDDALWRAQVDEVLRELEEGGIPVNSWRQRDEL